MRATKAYIASLGTTGVLLAASILMLGVVSAVVAFDRWPGAGVNAPVKTLVLNETPAAIRVSTNPTGPSATPLARGTTALAVAPRTGRAPVAATTPFIRGRRTTGTTPPVAAPALPAPVQKTLQPVQDTATPLFDAVSNPGGTAGQVADGAQQVTDAAGVSLGRISPDVANAVTGTGQAVAETVRGVPLPGHIIPGH